MRANNVYYLNDSGIGIEGIRFWGSPITPQFKNWAFMRKRGEEIKKHWNKIPDNTDVLITHGPPFGMLDKNLEGNNCGCEELMTRVGLIHKNLRYHLFGHIHEAFGSGRIEKVWFVNASSVNRWSIVVNAPVELDFGHLKGETNED